MEGEYGMKMLLTIMAFILVVLHIATNSTMACTMALVFSLIAYFIKED